MERDKRGRFIKKAQQGTDLLYKGKRFRLKNGVSPTILGITQSLIDDPSAYEEYLNTNFDVVEDTSPETSITPQVENVSTNTTTDPSLTSPISRVLNSYNSAQYGVVPNVNSIQFPDIQTRDEKIKALQARNFFGRSNDPESPFYQEQIGYTQNNGKFVDEYGVELNPTELVQNSHLYTRNFPSEGNVQVSNTDPSAGMTFTGKGNEPGKNKLSKFLNKTKLADFIDWTRAGIGFAVNNKIAERALEAEKPFLQDIPDFHRSITGDYRAKVEGEKAAAALRNMASKPLTSDGALQQQMMLEAQIKGQSYIDQGNAADEQRIKQTREAAWEQEKENQNLRNAVAMQNRQALLETQKNKAQIENVRDSANFSQVLAPLLAGVEQRLRNKGKEQEYYQDYYDDAMVTQQVWNDYTDGLTDSQKELVRIYKTQGSQGILNYIDGDKTKENDWLQLNQIMSREALRRKAALKNVTIDTGFGFDVNDPYSKWRPGSFYKKGGTIYKAKLTKRTRDNDRGAKSIESSKKIAARLLEKAIDSLYTYDQVEIIAKPSKNKRKYQAGGGLPFVSHTPVFATSETGLPETTKASKKESKKDTDLTTKDILDLLKEVDGLPVDIDVIEASLKNFILMDQLDPLGLDSTSSIEARYMSLISKIKKAKTNKEWYDKAYDKLRSDGALNEYAIDSTGHFIGMNDQGDFARFTAEQVSQGETSNYQLLTNSNLLDLRAQHPEAAFNSNLIMEAANGVGMKQINEFVNQIIQNLGSDKQETKVFGNQSKEVLAGLQQLQQAAQDVGQDLSVSELYQAQIFTESQAQQAQMALNYLYQALPSNMQALLFAKTGSKEGAVQMINSLVNSKLSSTNKLLFSPKNSGKKSSTSSKTGNIMLDGMDLSPAQMLQHGFGEREDIIIQDGSVSGLAVSAITMPITKNGGEPMGASTLADITTSQYGGVLNFTNASMGGKIIPFEGRRNIAVDATKIYSMYLPVDPDQKNKGYIVPDIALIDKVNEVNRIIREKKLETPEEINAVYEEAGLPVYMNPDGTVIPQNYQRFGVLNGTALDNAFGDKFVASKYLKPVEDETIIQGAIDIMNEGRSKEDKITYDAKNFFNFGGILGDYDTVYQGTIFIPISNDVFLGIAGSGKTVTTEEANDLLAAQQQKQRVSATYKNPGQLR